MVFIRHEEKPIVKENVQNGSGKVEVYPILKDDEEMYNKGRVYSKFVLPKGSEVGIHPHIGDFESYYILSGRGKYFIDNEWVDVFPGDSLYTGEGEKHGIRNESEEPLIFIGLILYTD